MAGTSSSEAATSEGPVMNLINKRLRALRKKHNRILQMEESISQGKPINKEQEDVLRSKPYVTASIEELEKLKQPLSVAISEEIDLVTQRQQQQPQSQSSISNDDKTTTTETNEEANSNGDILVEDLLNLLYFGSLFDVKSQNEFTATMLTRTHERGCCLTYDYVTDDATDLLGERDLDMISKLGALLISRPVDSSLSHKNALLQCIDHAKLWLSNSQQLIHPNANVSYAGLRERLNKIMASDYFITTPEMKAPVEVAAAGNYVSFQVPVHGVAPISVPVQQVEGSDEQYQEEDEETENFQGHETDDNQPSPAEEFHKDDPDPETEIPAEEVSGEQEQDKPSEMDNSQKEVDPKEQQYFARRNFQNQRGGRGGSGGGRRGYSNGRGGRSNGRGGGGYQNGRNQYYDQPGNYYQRNYYNNRGRGGRGGGHPYNNHGSTVHGGHGPADVGVAS